MTAVRLAKDEHEGKSGVVQVQVVGYHGVGDQDWLSALPFRMCIALLGRPLE